MKRKTHEDRKNSHDHERNCTVIYNKIYRV